MIEQAGLIVVAGGGSRRMGRDKRLLPFAGEPLLARTLRLLAGSFAEAAVVTAGDGAADAAAEETIRRIVRRFPGVRLLADAEPNAGPLAGLSAGLAAQAAPLQLAIGADMPFPSPALAEALLRLCRDSGAEAALPETAGRLHPLFAVYRRTLAAALGAYVAGGGRKVTDWTLSLRHVVLPEAEVRRVDPSGLALANMNRPEDYAAALRAITPEE
ncbi:molybdenum cofactor guanylyltransferase [Paenibacillus cymbidii]|uniref:molybdenum cofactor guanylyltransferase n=1 Tax=Paenibacillus cymbidii TaxID=1639034 RepID=UPI0010803E12|nr:molybdenum cofactor guanylyltransferase [Paenibacillus cymbidii]